MKVVRVVNNVAPVGSIAIGRGTVWGNPFIVGADGEREVVVAKFYHYAQWRLEREPNWLEPLRGKDLACYCSPKGCHGDAIIRLIEEIDEAYDPEFDVEDDNAAQYEDYKALEAEEAAAEFNLTSDMEVMV